jgi:hypothetical protein
MYSAGIRGYVRGCACFVRPDYAVAIGIEADKRSLTTRHPDSSGATVTICDEVLSARGRVCDAPPVVVTGHAVDDSRPVRLAIRWC